MLAPVGSVLPAGSWIGTYVVPVARVDGGQPVKRTLSWRRSSLKATPARTTWLNLLLASISVGRRLSISDVLSRSFAYSEIMVRIHSVRSALAFGVDASGTPVFVKSRWLRSSADGSERNAASYRIGMACAEWYFNQQLGMSSTTHIDSLAPGLPPRGAVNGSRADLCGEQIIGGKAIPWLIEAKASLGKEVGWRDRNKGCTQLAASASGMPLHGQMLMSAAADPFLHLVVDIGLPPGGIIAPTVRPPTAPVASRRLLYLFRRLLVGSMLRLDTARSLSVRGVGDIMALEMPGLDLAVGLTSHAYDRFVRSMAKLSGLAPGFADTPDFWIENFLSDETEVQGEWIASTEQSSRLLPVRTSDERYIAALGDDAGIVLLAGPSWAENHNQSHR
jgi:hypothetical protein